MTDLEKLESSFDGPIPRELRNRATAADRAMPRRKARKLPPVPAQLKPVSDTMLIAEMAVTMVDAATISGCCLEKDLWNAGFTEQQITKLSNQARGQAKAIADKRGLDLSI